MFSKAISTLVFVGGAFLAIPAGAWEQRVIEATERALNNARCVSQGSPNDSVHILNVPTDQSIMSSAEARTAVLDLADAFAPHYRFQLTRGGALPYEANTQPASQQGALEMQDLLDRLSDAAVTIFFFPYQRLQGSVRTEITLLVRSVEDGRSVLKCTPSFRVDIPVSAPPPPPVQQPVDDVTERDANIVRDRGWIGLQIQELTPDMAEAMGLTDSQGALVADVPDGPAMDAGIEPGDVITTFDGEGVDDVRHLVGMISGAAPGEMVRVGIRRAGQNQTVNVTLGRLELQVENPVLGLRLEELTSGITIAEVDEASEAWEKGLRAGDVIDAAGGLRIASIADFEARVETAREAGRQSVLLLALRNGDPRYIALSVAE